MIWKSFVGGIDFQLTISPNPLWSVMKLATLPNFAEWLAQSGCTGQCNWSNFNMVLVPLGHVWQITRVLWVFNIGRIALHMLTRMNIWCFFSQGGSHHDILINAKRIWKIKQASRHSCKHVCRKKWHVWHNDVPDYIHAILVGIGLGVEQPIFNLRPFRAGHPRCSWHPGHGISGEHVGPLPGSTISK